MDKTSQLQSRLWIHQRALILEKVNLPRPLNHSRVLERNYRVLQLMVDSLNPGT